MKFFIKKVPKTARALYIIGFLVIGVALFNYVGKMNWFDLVVSQQIFISGAILVALGSVVNTIYQFKK